MNVISEARKAQICAALVEGNSINSVSRMLDTHTDTIMRLLLRVGRGCKQLLHEQLRELDIRYFECDEIWTFVGKKDRQCTAQEKRSSEVGDQYIFVAMDVDTKLVPAFKVGKRDTGTTIKFMQTLKSRLKKTVRPHIITDGFTPYIEAVDHAFGADVDFAQLVKVPDVKKDKRECVLTIVSGDPETEHTSTSGVERQNLTMRMSIRRLTRATNAFSKRVKNLKAAIYLHFAHYNFMRIHSSLSVTPAMEAGITNNIWDWGDVLAYEKAA